MARGTEGTGDVSDPARGMAPPADMDSGMADETDWDSGDDAYEYIE